ncbi:MAG: MarR family transcriptional regulator [Chloroflexi bacterium]|nr:MarR family transcriptional regulator [Chloroflexota bacterium]
MAKDLTKMNENEKTWVRLFRTHTVLERAREMELSRVGITLPQAAVLYFLGTASETLTPTKLARLTYKEPHTISALLNRMEEQGLIKKTNDLKRKNLVRVSLAKKGEELFKRLLSERVVINITSCLSKKELDTLNELTAKLFERTIELLREMQPNPYGTTF